ncbi:ADP-ribosylglycohydrolase family protein [Eisenbergiella tayi]|uniref:ADP-ribosylglycohydrolase family protein n=1 Tax=Eisenbergiella tayi TaxID=1432052 RepID=UPI003AF1CBD4
MKINIIDDNTIDKLYAGWISKVIGVRLGAPVEGWTYGEIKEKYGKIDGYIADYKNFAADDDTNVPIFLIRAMEKSVDGYDLTAQDVANELLNYSPFEHGFFWWGGYGISSEHTAYANLINGIKAPRSGSVEQNGSTVAEQIGGQIFIDVWGLICPGDPQRAAYLAKTAASVTHDRNAVYGGIFIACCISIAYVENDIEEIIRKALAFIPADSEYARVVESVRDYHASYPQSWEQCYQFIFTHFGYDKYPGNCHIIPNTAVMILALLYGNSYDEVLNIGVMCGWDTDCNVGNIATVMGVRGGTKSIDFEKWYKPINDLMICSSTVGDLNINDNAQITDYLLKQMEKTTGCMAPGPLHSKIGLQCNYNHFEYSGSTHCMRVRMRDKGVFSLTNTEEKAYGGNRSLKVTIEPCPALEVEIYKKTYYFQGDFSDSRYDPSFSPIVYPGQVLHMAVMAAQGWECLCKFFARDSRQKLTVESEDMVLKKDSWTECKWKIPVNQKLELIDEVGIIIKKEGSEESPVYIDDFYWDGEPCYKISFKNENLEDWRIGEMPAPHFEVSQFTRWKGITFLDKGCFHLTGIDIASAFTGGSGWKDYSVEAEITPLIGDGHLLNFRVQGAMRSYAFGLVKNRAALLKNGNGYIILSEKEYLWQIGCTYRLKVIVKNNQFHAFINDGKIMEYTDWDEPYQNGGIGLTTRGNSHLKCSYIKVG